MTMFSNVSNKFLTISNSLLLLLIIFTIFIISFFPIEWHRILYSICFTFIFLLSALALSKDRARVFNIALVVIIIEWISELFNLSIINTISFLTNIVFFGFLVVLFIKQIAQAKTVTARVILESVTGYLMLGMTFTILISLVCAIDPAAFNFNHLTTQVNPVISYTSNYIYYAFVTLTTLGYGDIVPLTPAAKSLSIFTSIMGQMYVAIIIATIVSKYLSPLNKNN